MSVKPRVNLILDSLILVAFILTILSGMHLDNLLDSTNIQPGQAGGSILQLSGVNSATHLHILMSIAFIIFILVHQFVHWKWIVSQIKQLKGISRQPSRISAD